MIKKLILKYLGLSNFDEYLEKTERRFLDLESSADDFDDRIDTLERKDILDFDSDDFVSSQDYERQMDELDTKIQEVQDKEILDYESDDFVNCRDYETEKEEMQLKIDRLTKALKKLAFQSNIELRIDEILEGAED